MIRMAYYWRYFIVHETSGLMNSPDAPEGTPRVTCRFGKVACKIVFFCSLSVIHVTAWSSLLSEDAVWGIGFLLFVLSSFHVCFKFHVCLFYSAFQYLWHGNSKHDNDHIFQKWVKTIFYICILTQIRGNFSRFLIAFETFKKNVQKRRFVNSRGHGNSRHDKSLLRQMGFQFFATFQSRFE